MPPRSILRSIILAGLATTALLAPQIARAQGLIDFLWGGGQEWGGSRQVVTFDKQYSPNQIIVSFGDRRLYLLTKRGQAISYPIAVPRDQSRWQGTTAVSSKKENPSWRPTPDMIKENPKLPTWVPGGHPMNPLGVRAMYLGASTYRIHGTDAPWTIGQAVSKGCIRMTNEDVLDLYPRVPVGMKVTVTWQRFSTDGSSVAASNEEPSFSPAAQNVSVGHPSADSRNTIRNLAPLPRRVSDEGESPASGAGVPDDFVALDENGNVIPTKKPAKAKAKMDAVSDKGAEPKSEKRKEAAKASGSDKTSDGKTVEKAADTKPAETKSAKGDVEAKPANTAKVAELPKVAEVDKKDAADPVESARRAAAAASKAAEVAREAAEAAKKAAADAKKATSASGDGKEPDKAAVKSAAAAL